MKPLPGLGELVGRLAGDSVKHGVERLLDGIPLPPEAHALLQFLGRLYSGEDISLSEAEEKVLELIKSVEGDEEQRKLLLGRRSQLCRMKESYERFADFFEEVVLEDLGRRGKAEEEAIVTSLVALMRVLLAQCEPAWEALPAEAKARILAPLYMTLYHLKAYREAEKARRGYHAEAAETLALLALARAEEALGQ